MSTRTEEPSQFGSRNSPELPHDLVAWLEEWATNAEGYWREDPTDSGRGWYGSGFNAWGVQTNQKYFSALATLSRFAAEQETRDWAIRRALAALRFSLWSHHSGEGQCADGTSWGHTWISALGIERMMFAVDLMQPWLTEKDRTAVDAMLISECSWISSDFHRGGVHGVVADRWNSSGRNAPESNLWNGAMLWRTAARCPDHPEAGAWRELSSAFLVNSVSIAADARDQSIIDGRPIADRHVGANFFDSYSLDHHGYLNVGYMVICTSNAAMLHFDLRRRQEAAPESLHHHQRDLWQLVRRLIGTDGRLIRIGGDSRVRYAYCQEYLLPSLLYAADQLGDPYAEELLQAQLQQNREEQIANGDGSFYGHRLAHLAATSPYYYTRLESDRACALAMTLAHWDQVRFPDISHIPFEDTVAGGWLDAEHSAVLHRSPDRFASFAWRANGLSQGLCFPPDRADLAEWELNLAPEIVLEGTPKQPTKTGTPSSRRLITSTVEQFPGGFITSGSVAEGAEMVIAEGWSGGPAAISQVVVAALPDASTIIGMHYVSAVDWSPGVQSVKGLHLGVPNDVANKSIRTVSHAGGDVQLTAGGSEDDLGLGQWASVDNQLGIVGLYGADQLQLSRASHRRGGPQQSSYVEEFCFPLNQEPHYADAGSTLLDCGWAVLSRADAATTARFSARNKSVRFPCSQEDVRGMLVEMDSHRYLLVANFSDSDTTVPLSPVHRYLNLASQEATQALELSAGEAALCEVS